MITPRLFNAWFKSPYDKTLENGGTAPPSKQTVRNSILNDRDRRKRWTFKPPLCESDLCYYPHFETNYGVVTEEQEELYREISENIMNHLSGYWNEYAEIDKPPSELEEKLSILLPFPDFMVDESGSRLLEKTPGLFKYLKQELPLPVVAAIEKFLFNPLQYVAEINKNRDEKGYTPIDL